MNTSIFENQLSVYELYVEFKDYQMDPNETASLVPSGDKMFELPQIFFAQSLAVRSLVAWVVRAFTGKVMNVYQTKHPIH